MSQETVRIKLQKYLDKSGIKQKYIADKLNIPTDILSRFKTNKKDLFEDHLRLLDYYLDSMK